MPGRARSGIVAATFAAFTSLSAVEPAASPLPQTIRFGRARLNYLGAERVSRSGDVVAVRLHTSGGDIDSRFHAAPPASAAPQLGVLCVGGAGGGLDGPARGLYPGICERLQRAGIVGLRVDYRRPNELDDCVLDTLAGVQFLASEGVQRIALVGHSFGGAVVISAGAVSPHVKAVVPMSSQTYGADLAPRVSPRPMLLIHGTEDEVLPPRCSAQIYADAREPKELKLYSGAGHGLDSAREEILDLLQRWIPEKLASANR